MTIIVQKWYTKILFFYLYYWYGKSQINFVTRYELGIQKQKWISINHTFLTSGFTYVLRLHCEISFIKFWERKYFYDLILRRLKEISLRFSIGSRELWGLIHSVTVFYPVVRIMSRSLWTWTRIVDVCCMRIHCWIKVVYRDSTNLICIHVFLWKKKKLLLRWTSYNDPTWPTPRR